MPPGGSALQPVAAVELTVSEQRSDFPSIYVFLSAGKILFNLLAAVIHAQPDFKLVLQRKILEVEGLARADADAGKLLANDTFFRPRRCELQREVEILEEVFLREFLVDLWEVDGRRGSRRRLFQIGGKRLHLVAGLDLLNIRHVCRIEKLRAVGSGRKLRRGPEYLLDAGGRCTLPIRSNDHIVTSLAAGRAAADISVVERVAVAKHHRIVATLVNSRYGKNDRFGAQIEP